MTVSSQTRFFNGSFYPGERGEQRPSRSLNPAIDELGDSPFGGGRAWQFSGAPNDAPEAASIDPWSAAATRGADDSQSWAEPYVPAESDRREAPDVSSADAETPNQAPSLYADGNSADMGDDVYSHEAHSQQHIVYSYAQPDEPATDDTASVASPFFYEAQPGAFDVSRSHEPATAQPGDSAIHSARDYATEQQAGYSVEDEIRATQEALQRLQTLAARAMHSGAILEGAATDEAAADRPVAPLTSDAQLTMDPRFVKLTRKMQDGAWPEVLEGLRRLQRELPHSPTLAGLINEAELKAELVTLWDGKIKGRRLGVRTDRILRRSIPFAIVTIIFCLISLFYQVFIAPSREVVAQARTAQQLIEQAHAEFAAGRFWEARDIYDQVLEREPGHATAMQGRSEAQHQITLAAEYDLAMTVARTGNLTRAVAMLERLSAKAPHYRDVELQIKQMQNSANAKRLFAEAEAAFASGDWIVAVQKYEELRGLDTNYESATLDARMPEAYLRAGQAIVAQPPSEHLSLKQARDYFRKASGTAAFAEEAGLEDEMAQLYLRAERFHAQNELNDALNIWLGIYSERPAYLGGYMAEQIYRTTMLLGSQAQSQGEREFAEEMFRAAADLQVPDTSEARSKLEEMAATTP